MADARIQSLLAPTTRAASAAAAPAEEFQYDEDPRSLLTQVTGPILGAIGKVGSVLDLPGSMVRDVLVGENPFDQLLSPTTQDNRVEGRDVLERWGLMRPNVESGMSGWLSDPGEGLRDIGGFLLETATDPLNMLTRPAKAVTALGDAAQATRAGRGWVNNLLDPLRLSEAGQALGVRSHLTSTGARLPGGEGLIRRGMDRTSRMLSGTADALEKAPRVGPAFKDFRKIYGDTADAVSRAGKSLFDASVRGTYRAVVQPLISEFSRRVWKNENIARIDVLGMERDFLRAMKTRHGDDIFDQLDAGTKEAVTNLSEVTMAGESLIPDIEQILGDMGYGADEITGLTDQVRSITGNADTLGVQRHQLHEWLDDLEAGHANRVADGIVDPNTLEEFSNFGTGRWPKALDEKLGWSADDAGDFVNAELGMKVGKIGDKNWGVLEDIGDNNWAQIGDKIPSKKAAVWLAHDYARQALRQKGLRAFDNVDEALRMAFNSHDANVEELLKGVTADGKLTSVILREEMASAAMGVSPDDFKYQLLDTPELREVMERLQPLDDTIRQLQEMGVPTGIRTDPAGLEFVPRRQGDIAEAGFRVAREEGSKQLSRSAERLLESISQATTSHRDIYLGWKGGTGAISRFWKDAQIPDVLDSAQKLLDDGLLQERMTAGQAKRIRDTVVDAVGEEAAVKYFDSVLDPQYGKTLKLADLQKSLDQMVADVTSKRPAVIDGSGHQYFAQEAIEKALKTAGAIKSKGKVIEMSPDDFLKIARDVNTQGGWSAEKTKLVNDLMESGTPFETLPRLGFKFKDGDVAAQAIHHEGRHRARALRDAGVERMPVIFEGNIVWDRQATNDMFDAVKGDWPSVLKSETAGEIPFPVPDLRSQADIPLSFLEGAAKAAPNPFAPDKWKITAGRSGAHYVLDNLLVSDVNMESKFLQKKIPKISEDALNAMDEVEDAANMAAADKVDTAQLERMGIRRVEPTPENFKAARTQVNRRVELSDEAKKAALQRIDEAEEAGTPFFMSVQKSLLPAVEEVVEEVVEQAPTQEMAKRLIAKPLGKNAMKYLEKTQQMQDAINKMYAETYTEAWEKLPFAEQRRRRGVINEANDKIAERYSRIESMLEQMTPSQFEAAEKALGGGGEKASIFEGMSGPGLEDEFEEIAGVTAENMQLFDEAADMMEGLQNFEQQMKEGGFSDMAPEVLANAKKQLKNMRAELRMKKIDLDKAASFMTKAQLDAAREALGKGRRNVLRHTRAGQLEGGSQVVTEAPKPKPKKKAAPAEQVTGILLPQTRSSVLSRMETQMQNLGKAIAEDATPDLTTMRSIQKELLVDHISRRWGDEIIELMPVRENGQRKVTNYKPDKNGVVKNGVLTEAQYEELAANNKITSNLQDAIDNQLYFEHLESRWEGLADEILKPDGGYDVYRKTGLFTNDPFLDFLDYKNSVNTAKAKMDVFKKFIDGAVDEGEVYSGLKEGVREGGDYTLRSLLDQQQGTLQPDKFLDWYAKQRNPHLRDLDPTATADEVKAYNDELRAVKQQLENTQINSADYRELVRGLDLNRNALADMPGIGSAVKFADALTRMFKVGVLAWPARIVRDFSSATLRLAESGVLDLNSPGHALESMKMAFNIALGRKGQAEGFAELLRNESFAREFRASPHADLIGSTAEEIASGRKISESEAVFEYFQDRFFMEQGGAYHHTMQDAMDPAFDPNVSGSLKPLRDQIPNVEGRTVRERASNLLGDYEGRKLAAMNPANLSGMPRWFTADDALRGKVRTTTDFLPARVADSFGQFTDASTRAAAIIDQVRRGQSFDSAMQRAKDTLVDYDPRRFSWTEKEVLKRVFPFYSFLSSQVPYVMKELLNNPAGGLGKTIRAQRHSQDDQYVPYHMRDKAAIPWRTDADGSQHYVSSLGMMHEDAVGMLDPDLADILGNMNPLLKAPVELATGRSLFMRGPLGGRELSEMDPAFGRIVQRSGELLGLREESDARPVSPIGATGEHLLSNSPAARVVSTVKTMLDNRKSLAQRAVNLLSGVKFTTISPENQQSMLRAELDAVLKERGVRPFTRYSLRKGEIEEIEESGDQELAMKLRAVEKARAVLDKAQRARRQQEVTNNQ